jgi:ketopantoate reductase
MEYTGKFIEEVKTEYPDWEELHDKLRRGDIRVGDYLAEKSDFRMKADEILKAFNEGRQEDIKMFAEQCVRRKKLHVEWWKINADWMKKKLAVNC